jgi:hypothetical protein
VSRAAHDESVWLKKVYEFIQEHIIKVNCPMKSEPLQREGNVYIMEQAYKLGLSDTEIKYVNYCWLYLDVITLADITDKGGSYICNEAWIRLNIKKTLQEIKAHLQPKPALITFLVNMEEGYTTIYYFKLQKTAASAWQLDNRL